MTDPFHIDGPAGECSTDGQDLPQSGNRVASAERPKRIQRKRTKGWTMPEGAIYVGRPTKWGNPFTVSPDPTRVAHYADYTKNVDLWDKWPCKDRDTAVLAYREMIASRLSLLDLDELRGKDLACWCPLDQPCHADVLLELANTLTAPGSAETPPSRDELRRAIWAIVDAEIETTYADRSETATALVCRVCECETELHAPECPILKLTRLIGTGRWPGSAETPESGERK